MSKELDVLVKKAREQGWTVVLTKNNHYKWMSPLGGLFYSASTPSDYRAVYNLRQNMKNNGFIEIQKTNRRKK
jgi:hypothetical protein